MYNATSQMREKTCNTHQCNGMVKYSRSVFFPGSVQISVFVKSLNHIRSVTSQKQPVRVSKQLSGSVHLLRV